VLPGPGRQQQQRGGAGSPLGRVPDVLCKPMQLSCGVSVADANATPALPLPRPSATLCNAVTNASVQRGSLFYTLEVLRIRIVNPSKRDFLMYTWFCYMTVTKRNAYSY
jgi:hypothetical protein